MLDRLAVIDVETSGTDPAVHALLSLAIVPFQRGKRSLNLHIRPPNIQWTEYARRNFTRFSAEWERDAVEPDGAMATLENYLECEFGGQSVTAVGHNIGFDLAFIRVLAHQCGRNLSVLSHRAVDTHSILFYLCLKGAVPETALSSDGAFRHFQIRIPDRDRHTALGDANATRQLLICLLQQFEVCQMLSKQMEDVHLPFLGFTE